MCVRLFVWIVLVVLSPLVAVAQHKVVQDTLLLKSPSVVFYTCQNAEYDSLAQGMLFALDSLVQQHELTKKQLIPFLNKFNISFLSTTAVTILFLGNDTTCFNRQLFCDLAGIILFSPTLKPEFLPAEVTDVVAIGRIRKYFHLR
jgi:hypothetical protein